ncbi:hypothetical protein [Streptomyces sp. NPDC096311]|uniref:hypothetical protein n=1 Tax=Streptomyces sp. NPDC096311 TaxID=3366083 RepID=UPI003808DA52
MPAPRSQCVRLVLEAEIFQDLEGGPDELVVTTDELACEPVAPARLRRMVADARATLDAIERLARRYEAEDTLRAILAEHDLTLVEVAMDEVAEFGPDLAARLQCWSGKENGRQIVWVPQGQDPVERVDAIAKLVNDLADQAGVQV